MKTSTRKTHPISLGWLIVTAIIVLLGATTSQADKLVGRPLPPQEIHDNHLDGAIASGGLLTVGVGEPVYLEAMIGMEPVVSGVTWNLMSSPAGSSAVLETSPIPMEMPIYSPADREVYQVADRMMLVPDVAGVYMVEAVVQTDGGDIVLGADVTGANYVGVGVVNDPNWTSASYPQCALCHAWDPDGKVESYMGTGHATFLEEAIDGIKSSHYGSYCLDCHVLGGHAPDADNGNFASVAEHVGWTFPEVLEPGNWDAMPLELKEKANIQCEHCHGAGSEHHGIKETISVSLNSGDCAQCHDEEPYHNKNRQWALSGHAVATRYPTGSERRSGCVKCHSGIGFIQDMDGIIDDEKSVEYEAIVCAACHDPHTNHGDNHQLRSTEDIAFENGHVVTEGGNGKFCLNCHKARRNADEYVQGSVSSHFGPHYGVQGDLFHGTNAIEYGKVIGGPSVHLYAVEDSCVGCHMQAVSRDDPAKNMAGEHTFRMTWDVNNTPDDHHDDVAMGGVCADCHGPVDSFDIPRYDYNYDGVLEGIQTEVHHLLEALAMKLHPVGSPEVVRGDENHVYSDAEKKAIYNYMCVEEDGSFGLHNPRYITEILRASINDLAGPVTGVLGGINIPVGGPWYHSAWFDFYSPVEDTDGWIYHVYHGYMWVEADGDNLLIYDRLQAKWFYTNADLYPILLDVEANEWLSFEGKYGNSRYFYNYSKGEYSIVD